MFELNQREANLLNTLKNSKYSLEELQVMLAGAMKDNRLDFADGLQEIIDQQYPQMTETPTSRDSRHCSAIFHGKTRDFDTAVDAFIWLVESMIEHWPNPPGALLNDSVFQQTVAIGKHGARYFAESPDALFPCDPERASDSRKSFQLKNGLYLNLNLSNNQKDHRLYALASACALKQGIDWSWTAVSDVQIPIEELLASIGWPPKRSGSSNET